MEEQLVSTLVELLNIPSPTGRADAAITYVEERLKDLPYSLIRTHKGGLLLEIPGKDEETIRFITAHVDTLGAMVKQIKESGRLRITAIGGVTWHSLDGEGCTIETQSGRCFRGTILATHSTPHVYADARTQPRTEENMEVRLDARVRDADEVRRLGINVGDFVFFDPRVEVTETGFVKSRHLDDKASVAILIELIRRIADERWIPPVTTHIFFSNYEEVGHGANAVISEKVREYLAVDMGAIGEGQESDEFSVSICAKDSSGPYHFGLRQKLVHLAEQHGIRYRVDLYPRYSSDASAALQAGHDLIWGLIGPGVDSSHAYERTHREALVHTYRLLYHYLQTPSL
ncbi:M42 family metallopeptidase [Polycladomyces subterraneus]|uniref:M42 family metallopeptidase n=1 Tax=Polycladomyces subterraneus TaxID=1016997 RepID=A0ABT8IRH1_9BACL|nr:M42 family metallopeptidase [Polycladomyces subterraneus]MDN4595318.1 M42 family metallopeptidase [Polycladomyces subterraneus]